MELRVLHAPGGGYQLVGGSDADIELANRFLQHLAARNFAVASRRAYAYDLLNFFRFLADRRLAVAAVLPADLFDYLDWQGAQRAEPDKVLRLASCRVAPATLNRRIAAVRGLFEFAVITGVFAGTPLRYAQVCAKRGARQRTLWVVCRRRLTYLSLYGNGRAGRDAKPAVTPGALAGSDGAVALIAYCPGLGMRSRMGPWHSATIGSYKSKDPR